MYRRKRLYVQLDPSERKKTTEHRDIYFESLCIGDR